MMFSCFVERVFRPFARSDISIAGVPLRQSPSTTTDGRQSSPSSARQIRRIKSAHTPPEHANGIQIVGPLLPVDYCIKYCRSIRPGKFRRAFSLRQRVGPSINLRHLISPFVSSQFHFPASDAHARTSRSASGKNNAKRAKTMKFVSDMSTAGRLSTGHQFRGFFLTLLSLKKGILAG